MACLRRHSEGGVGVPGEYRQHRATVRGLVLCAGSWFSPAFADPLPGGRCSIYPTPPLLRCRSMLPDVPAAAKLSVAASIPADGSRYVSRLQAIDYRSKTRRLYVPIEI